jgi:hypothetical protein
MAATPLLASQQALKGGPVDKVAKGTAQAALSSTARIQHLRGGDIARETTRESFFDPGPAGIGIELRQFVLLFLSPSAPNLFGPARHPG